MARIDQNFHLKMKHPISITLTRLFITILLLAHYNACGYHYFTLAFSDPNKNWMKFYEIADDTWEVRYIASLYFSFITMVTVGYGDVVPQTSVERVYTIVFVLISAIIFAYVVNTIGALFSDI